MTRNCCKSALLCLLTLFAAACGAVAQTESPTVMPSPTVEQFIVEPTVDATLDINVGLDGAPGADIASVAATSEAVSAPIQRALANVAGLQSVLSVSAAAVDAGIAVHIEAEIAPENDNETTMGRILEVVQAQGVAVAQVNVRTWAGTVLQRSWAWANGSWTAE